MSDSLRYPIGTFTAPDQVSEDERQQYIVDIAHLPQQIAEAVETDSSMPNWILPTAMRAGQCDKSYTICPTVT